MFTSQVMKLILLACIYSFNFIITQNSRTHAKIKYTEL